MAKPPRLVARQIAPGIVPGARMPHGGPMIYVGDLQPGFILLQRYTFNFGFTEHRDVLRRVRAVARATTGRVPAGKQVDNPYGGRSGWLLYGFAQGHERGPAAGSRWQGRPRDDAATLRYFYKQVPSSDRLSLFPTVVWAPNWKEALPTNDPLSSPGRFPGRWVSDECIVGMILRVTRGAQGYPPLRFTVRRTQKGQKFPGAQGPPPLIDPLQIITGLFQEAEGRETCSLETPKKFSLQQAASRLGFRSLTKPISMAAGKLYQAWHSKMLLADARSRLVLNAAYHRILVHRFLVSVKNPDRGRPRLLPPISKFKRDRILDRELERQANLIQAHRVFVFNKDGCPVGLNLPFVESMGIETKPILDRNALYADFTRGSSAARWVAWLYKDILRKSVADCKPGSELYGLGYLLAAVEQLR